MTPTMRMRVACAVIGALALPASAFAQPFYFFIGKNRPDPAPNAGQKPHSGLRIPATRSGATGFAHWNCREFPDCRVPYAINQNGTPDVAGVGDRIAVQNAFTTWENVSPAIIGFDRRINTLTPTAGMDNENVMLWDGGNAANQALLGAPGSGTIALTCLFTNTRGVILESDILFNDVDFQWNTTADNLVDVLTANMAPFNVNNGQTLTISVDGGANQTVTFAGIATGGAATAAEIGQNIINQVAGVNVLVIGGTRVKVTSVVHNGTGTVNVNGGTAAAALAFPAGAILTDAVDVETIAVHEAGHLLGIHHTSQASPELDLVLKNAVMFWLAPPTGTKRVLEPNDVQALNFLYTPDLGDAPDPAAGGGPFNQYQTLVHGNGNGRVLNGVQLSTVGLGPEHLFGYQGPVIPGVPSPTAPAPTATPAEFAPMQDYSHDRFEWLGADMDDSAQECEAQVPDLDLFDDGVTLPAHLIAGGKNRVVVRVSTDNPGGRYNNGNAGQRLYFNGYFDFNANNLFEVAERAIFWSGVPGTTSASSPNFIAGASNLTANPMVLAFDVQAPPVLPTTPFYSRFRLDFGEDEGRAGGVPAGGWEGDLAAAVGAAQFGEVEDFPAPPLFDHFQCYEIHRHVMNLDGVSLVDQFGPSIVRIKKAKRLCAPANKNGEDPSAPTHPAHLTSYTIKQTAPLFQRLRGVEVADQFGSFVVDLLKPDRLLVPTAKSLGGTPPPLLDPPDHFKCYLVKAARFRQSGISVVTQFGPMVVDIQKPLHLCTPVDKNGEGVIDPDTHLMCYRVHGPRPQASPSVFTLNQFGPDEYPFFGPRELCVPASKRLPSPTPTATPGPGSPTDTPTPPAPTDTPEPLGTPI